MIVLDTNVISDLLAPRPNPAVESWLAAQRAASVFTTSITEAEILYGIHLLPEGRRRRDLEQAIVSIFAEDFRGRILPFDSAAASVYATLAAKRRRAGRPITQFDAQIAAISMARGSALATRNVKDFEGLDIVLIDPWQGG